MLGNQDFLCEFGLYLTKQDGICFVLTVYMIFRVCTITMAKSCSMMFCIFVLEHAQFFDLVLLHFISNRLAFVEDFKFPEQDDKEIASEQAFVGGAWYRVKVSGV